MLVLTRKKGQSIIIGKDVKIVIADVSGETVRIGIEAPLEMEIYRTEVYQHILKENMESITTSRDTAALLKKNQEGK